jgi:ribosomal protein S18 acetylase RimI-like enzyme
MRELEEGLYRLQKKDIPQAVSVLADAFRDDPIWNKIFEEVSWSDPKLHAFFETPIRYCLHFGDVCATSKNLEGIAAWIPGNLAKMSFWRLIQSGAIRPAMKIGFKLGKELKPLFAPIQEDRDRNMEGRSFIYLQIIGVAAAHQRKGFGTKLLEPIIAESERIGAPLYLETETEFNVAIYEKFGFKLIKRIVLPEIELPMWEMVRETR